MDSVKEILMEEFEASLHVAGIEADLSMKDGRYSDRVTIIMYHLFTEGFKKATMISSMVDDAS